MKKTFLPLLILLLTALFVLTALGCPSGTPEPADEDTPEQTTEPDESADVISEAEPVDYRTSEDLVSTFAFGPLETVIVDFFGAMAEPDFEKAKTFCTEELWEENFSGMEEMVGMFTEEEMKEMMGEMEMGEEQENDLKAAVSSFDGDTASLTITDSEGLVTVFGYVKQDGDWILSSME